MVMEEDIKKITINKNETSTKRKSQTKSQVKKLAEDPNKVREYVQEKMKNIKQDGLKNEQQKFKVTSTLLRAISIPLR